MSRDNLQKFLKDRIFLEKEEVYTRFSKASADLGVFPKTNIIVSFLIAYGSIILGLWYANFFDETYIKKVNPDQSPLNYEIDMTIARLKGVILAMTFAVGGLYVAQGLHMRFRRYQVQADTSFHRYFSDHIGLAIVPGMEEIALNPEETHAEQWLQEKLEYIGYVCSLEAEINGHFKTVAYLLVDHFLQYPFKVPLNAYQAFQNGNDGNVAAAQPLNPVGSLRHYQATNYSPMPDPSWFNSLRGAINGESSLVNEESPLLQPAAALQDGFVVSGIQYQPMPGILDNNADENEDLNNRNYFVFHLLWRVVMMNASYEAPFNTKGDAAQRLKTILVIFLDDAYVPSDSEDVAMLYVYLLSRYVVETHEWQVGVLSDSARKAYNMLSGKQKTKLFNTLGNGEENEVVVGMRNNLQKKLH